MRNFKSYSSDFFSETSRIDHLKISRGTASHQFLKSEFLNNSKDSNGNIFLLNDSVEHNFISSLRNIWFDLKDFFLRQGDAFVVSYNSDTRLFYLSEHGNEITRDLNNNIIVPGELSMKKNR